MIVLQYDPYSQTARFKSESEETGAVSDFKNLNKSQKDALKMLEENIILQNQIENLVKVLKTIDSRQRFRFIGTMKDYRDFEAGLKELAPSGCVEKSDTPFFYEPTYIREQLQKICGTVRQDVDALNKKYPEYCESLHFDSSELDTMLADRTPLVFMGSGSAGKSSVINAIVGAEILPTGDGTTTEFVCEIIPDNYCYAVSYQQNGSTSKIDLNGTQADAEANMNAVLHAEIRLDTENRYDWVYTAVNELSKWDNIEELQVRVPFKNLSAISSQIVIYDTPGPDSKTRSNHKEILNAALGRFKKGVAVFVTRRTEIEKTNLRSFLKEYTDNSEQLLDILNVNAGIVIVNGADETNLSKIEEGKESRKKHLEQAADVNSKLDFLYEQDRMIYFSSPFALGIQKSEEDNWKDSKFEELYGLGLVKMYDADNKFYLPLAKTADLPVLRKQAIIRAYEEAEKRYLENKNDENRKELIAHNSGLRAVEYEFGFVVNELSICNLCAQAQKQLEGILDAVKKSSGKIGREISDLETQKRKIFEAKYQDILDKLFKADDSALATAKKAVNEGVSTGASYIDTDAEDAAVEEITERIRAEWSRVKKAPQDEIKKIIFSSMAIAKAQLECNERAGKYYYAAFEQFKDACQEIISGSDQLNLEEQAVLESCVKGWQVVKYDAGKVRISKERVKTQILVFSFANKRKCLEIPGSLVPGLMRDMTLRTADAVKEYFEASCENARDNFYTEDRIKELSPELRAISEEIDRLSEQKRDYAGFQQKAEVYFEKVSTLTKLHKKKGAV